MKAFLKTLFGDADTLFVVAMVMVAEVLMADMTAAAFAVPALVLAGAAWLATR